MNRLNVRLDERTWAALEERARAEGKPRAAMARELLREALAQRREAAELALASDYAGDESGDLGILEAAQLELLDGEGG